MKSKIIATTFLGVGLLIGASALSAVAAWTAPTDTPPTCNSGSPGCDAPINVGGSLQSKLGTLNLIDLVAANFKLTNPNGTVTGIADGSVLMADGANTGKVKWGSVAAGGGVTVSQEYVLNTHANDSETVNMGAHKMCFIKGISGYDTDTGRIGCYITTGTDGAHTLNKWRAICRAACID